MVYVRKSDGAVCMPLDVFKRFDYGRACQMLGLSPSRPRANAGQVAKRGRPLDGRSAS